MFTLSITRFIELNIGSLAEELDVLNKRSGLLPTRVNQKTNVGLLLADHDRSLQMYMYDHQQLLVARLEEEMFDIAE